MLINNISNIINCNPGYQDISLFDCERKREIKTAIWYPTLSSPDEVTYLAHFKGKASINAPILELNFPLIMISHGARGHRYNQYYLAEHLAKKGFIVAAVEHPHDTAFDDSLTDSNDNLWHRPLDIKFVIKSLCNTRYFRDYINLNQIGIVGHSFGGFTAAVLAGAMPIKIQDDAHDFSICISEDIRAIVLLAPALANYFDQLKCNINIPSLLFKSDIDEILNDSDLEYLHILQDTKYICLENSGHYVYLMECPDPIIDQCPEASIDIGAPRKEIHPIINSEIESFFEKLWKL